MKATWLGQKSRVDKNKLIFPLFSNAIPQLADRMSGIGQPKKKRFIENIISINRFELFLQRRINSPLPHRQLQFLKSAATKARQQLSIVKP